MAQRLIGGRYELEAPLGGGGMASVWRARDRVLEREVAVKLLAHDADRDRFDREARAAALLAHPNIVRLYDFGESDEGPFIVYELVPGGTLEDRLAPGTPLDDDEAARVAEGVAAGLAYAHANGVVHRDLKPANILFDAEDRPRIADFGIARLAGAGTLTEAGTVLGTAAYISPEQAAGETATAASDVYSFGVILFRLLTGRLPFEADEPMALAAMHVHEQPPSIVSLRPDAPVRLESVATAALAKDPADRPQDGTALLAELAPGGATAVSAERRRERTRHRLVPAVVAAAVLAAAGAALALLAASSGDDPDPVATTSSRTDVAPITTATAAAPRETEPPRETTAPQTTEQETTAPETTREAPTTAPTETELPPLPTESTPAPPPTTATTPVPTG